MSKVSEKEKRKREINMMKAYEAQRKAEVLSPVDCYDNNVFLKKTSIKYALYKICLMMLML